MQILLCFSLADKVTELSFKDLLIFITGANEVTSLGFPRKPYIDFYEHETDSFALCINLYDVFVPPKSFYTGG